LGMFNTDKKLVRKNRRIDAELAMDAAEKKGEL